MLGIAPARTAQAKSTGAGAWSRLASISPVNPASDSRVAGMMTRLWPSRSTIREICGASSAFDNAKQAATVPASQYCPLPCEIMVTMPSETIAIGIRAMKPAAEKPSAPGARKISR